MATLTSHTEDKFTSMEEVPRPLMAIDVIRGVYCSLPDTKETPLEIQVWGHFGILKVAWGWTQFLHFGFLAF